MWANIYVALGLLGFWCGTVLARSHSVNGWIRKRFSASRYVAPRNALVVLLFSLFVSAVIFWYNGFDLNQLFFRGVIDELLTGRPGVDVAQPINLIFKYLVRPIPIILFLVYYFYYFGVRIGLIERLLLFFCSFLHWFLLHLHLFLASLLVCCMVHLFCFFCGPSTARIYFRG